MLPFAGRHDHARSGHIPPPSGGDGQVSRLRANWPRFSLSKVTHGCAERHQIAISGSSHEVSSSVPALTKARVGRQVGQARDRQPQAEQKVRWTASCVSSPTVVKVAMVSPCT